MTTCIDDKSDNGEMSSFKNRKRKNSPAKHKLKSDQNQNIKTEKHPMWAKLLQTNFDTPNEKNTILK